MHTLIPTVWGFRQHHESHGGRGRVIGTIAGARHQTHDGRRDRPTVKQVEEVVVSLLSRWVSDMECFFVRQLTSFTPARYILTYRACRPRNMKQRE